MASNFTENERFVLERIARGEIADFASRPGYSEDAKPKISALFLRELLLGFIENQRIPMPGVRIKGALLIGRLDLTDCAGPSGGLSALILESCDLPDPIDVSGGRLARFSIDHSRFREIVGIGLRIDGDFTFNSACPLTESVSDANALIRLRSAHIGGDVRGRDARLSARNDEERPTALSLQSANISGSIILTNAIVDGSVSMAGVKIGGGLICTGSRFFNEQGSALIMSNADVAGDVMLNSNEDTRFEARGAVILRASRIGGYLICEGASLHHPTGFALDAGGTNIGIAVLLRSNNSYRFEVQGCVFFLDSKIGGSLECQGGLFRNPGKAAIVAKNTQIDGTVLLSSHYETGQRFEAEGEITFLSAKIGVDFDCTGARLLNSTAVALQLRNVEVAKNIDLSSSVKQRIEVEGEIDLSGAKVGGYVNCEGGHFSNPAGYAIQMGSAEIRTGVLLRAENGHRFEARGGVYLLNVLIDGPLDCRGGLFQNPSGAAIVANNMRISGGVFLYGADELRFESNGAVLFQGATIDGEFDCSGGLFSFANGYALDLNHAKCSGDLLLCSDGSCRFESQGGIALNEVVIGGILSCQGGWFNGGDRPAIFAQGAKIGGSALLRSAGAHRFEAAGRVSFLKANISGHLECQGGKFEEPSTALLVAHAVIGGSVFLHDRDDDRFEARGLVSLSQTSVAGALICDGGYFFNPDGQAIDLEGADISKDVLLNSTARHRVELKGSLNSRGAKIGGHVSSSGGYFNNAPHVALDFSGADIGGDISFFGRSDEKLEVEGAVVCINAKIGGDFVGMDCLFKNASADAINMRGARIGRDVRLQSKSAHGLEVEGSVDFLGSSIGGMLYLSGGCFVNPSGGALVFLRTQIGGDVLFGGDSESPFKVLGGVWFDGSQINGSVRGDGGSFSSSAGYALSLLRATVGGDVRLVSPDGHRFEATGAVVLNGADIAGTVECDRASLNGPDVALSAINAKVGGDMKLSGQLKLLLEVSGRIGVPGVLWTR